MAGVRPADGGQVLFAGVDLGEHLDAFRSVLGYVPQDAIIRAELLCFPAVLFSGAILPVNVMAGAGAAISGVMPDRWALEAVGRDLRVRELLAEGGSPLGPPLLKAYGDAGTSPTTTYRLYLLAFTAVFFVGARIAVGLRCRAGTR